jgi:hypothetical protein
MHLGGIVMIDYCLLASLDLLEFGKSIKPFPLQSAYNNNNNQACQSQASWGRLNTKFPIPIGCDTIEGF